MACLLLITIYCHPGQEIPLNQQQIYANQIQYIRSCWRNRKQENQKDVGKRNRNKISTLIIYCWVVLMWFVRLKQTTIIGRIIDSNFLCACVFHEISFNPQIDDITQLMVIQFETVLCSQRKLNSIVAQCSWNGV